MSKKIIICFLMALCLLMSVPMQTGTVAFAKTSTTSTPKIKTAKELEKYLKKNYGKLKTNIKTFDLKDHIMVIENEDENYCFDIAIVVDWSAIGDEDYRVQSSIKYTKAQKKAFDESLKTYQKKIASAAIKVMPKKKIRGGYLDYGYKYPALEMDYYEGAIFGWSNYEYKNDETFPGYYDTKVSKFHWHNFDELEDPFDMIGVY